jgi:hypothetical protein
MAAPVMFLLGEQQLLFSAVAAALCLVPMLATLLWAEISLGGAPEQVLAAVMGGTALRMVVVVGIGMVLYYKVPGFESASFWLWILGFYLWTLGVEVLLVQQRQATMDRAGHS